MKGLKVLSRREWITSHTLFIASLISATIFLHSTFPHTYAGFATAAIWCFAGGLCYLFTPAFAKLVVKQ